MMYNKGKKSLLNKKDKTTEEIEVEKSKGEMTFKPNINRNDNIIYNQQLIENYTINDYDKYNSILEKFSDRMKNGRIEREIKEKALERFASPNRESLNNKKEKNVVKESRTNNNTQLKTLNSKNQEKVNSLSNSKNKQNLNQIKSNLQNETNSKNNKKENLNPGKYFGNLDYNSINEKDYNQFSDGEQKDIKSSKSKQTPILVIDVNLDQNNKKDKKQILVYNGDNSIDLAKKFANANSKIFII